jgi:hypothetical protein
MEQKKNNNHQSPEPQNEEKRIAFNKMAMLAEAMKEIQPSMDDEDIQIMEALKNGKTIWERPTKQKNLK